MKQMTSVDNEARVCRQLKGIEPRTSEQAVHAATTGCAKAEQATC